MTERPKNNSTPSGGEGDSGSVVPPAVRALRATLRGEKPNVKSAPETSGSQAGDIFPKAAKLKQERALMKDAKIGEEIEGKGIYAGTWQPKDREGQSLSQTFYVFSAPRDLMLTFTQAVKKLPEMKNWHGYDGFNHRVKGKKADEVLYDALKGKSYRGEWVIPPFEVLEKNLYQNRYAFKNVASFTNSKEPHKASYLSCEEGGHDGGSVKNLHFFAGNSGMMSQNLYLKSLRLVRLEPAL